ncbi:MAG: hypothetical protein M3O30_06025 [Planctomycetota bacterium]|nr:hypothetical protein [Planctomycetota bacterium]
MAKLTLCPMRESQPENQDFVHMLEPWFPLFARVGKAALRDFHAAIPMLGLPRKTERANDLHRAWRNNFRNVCDLAEPMLALREEPDGQGLDYLLCQMNPDMPFVLRWGRTDGETIHRNRTERNRTIQAQGRLFASMEPDPSELPVLTLAHTIEDEYTQAGRSCLWMGRLFLVRERPGENSETITEVHVYQNPSYGAGAETDVPPAIVVARQNEREEWGQIIQQIRDSA